MRAQGPACELVCVPPHACMCLSLHVLIAGAVDVGNHRMLGTGLLVFGIYDQGFGIYIYIHV